MLFFSFSICCSHGILKGVVLYIKHTFDTHFFWFIQSPFAFVCFCAFVRPSVMCHSAPEITNHLHQSRHMTLASRQRMPTSNVRGLSSRVGQNMAYIFPILRDETHVPYLWQYLERQDPILTNVQREAPAGEQNFALPGAKKSKSLKSCALRAPGRSLRRPQSRHFAPDK